MTISGYQAAVDYSVAVTMDQSRDSYHSLFARSTVEVAVLLDAATCLAWHHSWTRNVDENGPRGDHTLALGHAPTGAELEAIAAGVRGLLAWVAIERR